MWVFSYGRGTPVTHSATSRQANAFSPSFRSAEWNPRRANLSGRDLSGRNAGPRFPAEDPFLGHSDAEIAAFMEGLGLGGESDDEEEEGWNRGEFFHGRESP